MEAKLFSLQMAALMTQNSIMMVSVTADHAVNYKEDAMSILVR